MCETFEYGDYVYFMNYELGEDVLQGIITHAFGIEINHIRVPKYFAIFMELSKDMQEGVVITDIDIKRKIYNFRGDGCRGFVTTNSLYSIAEVGGYYMAIDFLTFKDYEKALIYYKIFLRTCIYVKQDLHTRVGKIQEGSINLYKEHLFSRNLVKNFFK